MYDTITTLPFDEMRTYYFNNYSLGNLGIDINKRFALISLICYLTYEFKKKKPDVTYYQVIRKIDEQLPEDYAKKLAILCEDFGYNCKTFPTFGVKPKEMPNTIKSILNEWLPF